MTIGAPPRPPEAEPELLIPEARARQRKRWLIAAVFVAVLAGAALGIDSIVGSAGPGASSSSGPNSAGSGTEKCGIRVAGPRILSSGGSTLYREPIRHEVHPNAIPSQVQCSGSNVWVVWDNGAGMMQEAYVGARSFDSGRTWKLVFAESFFGVKAPHELASYLGPWALRGDGAYFVGWCPACSAGKLDGTTSLWVTRDGGRTFREYPVPGLLGYEPVGLRLAGRNVTVAAKRFIRGVEPFHKSVTIRVP
jgi:hypothetical protein